MQKSDESMKWPFAREDVVDNLIDWAEKIKTLGRVWGSLSWHVNHYNGDDDALRHCGETFGSIIMDYAGLIEDTVTENMNSFVDLDKNVVFSLAGCQEVYDFINEKRRPEDICAVDYNLNELTAFIKNAALPAIGLKENFLELKKSLMAKQEKAPDAVGAAPGA